MPRKKPDYKFTVDKSFIDVTEATNEQFKQFVLSFNFKINS